jgi:hypothetical protein
LGSTNDRARSTAWWFPALCHFGVTGGGGIFAAASFAATGDAGAEFVDESSPQPVIAPTKTNNAKTRSARCMSEPPQRECADSGDKAKMLARPPRLAPTSGTG